MAKAERRYVLELSEDELVLLKMMLDDGQTDVSVLIEEQEFTAEAETRLKQVDRESNLLQLIDFYVDDIWDDLFDK